MQSNASNQKHYTGIDFQKNSTLLCVYRVQVMNTGQLAIPAARPILWDRKGWSPVFSHRYLREGRNWKVRRILCESFTCSLALQAVKSFYQGIVARTFSLADLGMLAFLDSTELLFCRDPIWGTILVGRLMAWTATRVPGESQIGSFWNPRTTRKTYF